MKPGGVKARLKDEIGTVNVRVQCDARRTSETLCDHTG
jgi:hypothetical protein